MVPPAVIVIGKTAACRYHYCGKTSQRVGVTATKALQKKLEREFAAIGMEAVPVCDMKIVKTGQMARLRQELGHLEEYQWVVFTSQNAVSVFFEEMRDCRIDIRRLGGVKFAASAVGQRINCGNMGLLLILFHPAILCRCLPRSLWKA